MSLDKAIIHGKEHRKKYRGAKAVGGLTMEQIDLKPCPFCGCYAAISPVYDSGGKYKDYYTVFCANELGCSASVDGEECLDEGEAKASAIERWNRRANDGASE